MDSIKGKYIMRGTLRWIVPILASGSPAGITPSSGRLLRVDFVRLTGPLRTPSCIPKKSAFDLLMVKPMVFVDFPIVSSAQLTVLGISLKACKMLMCL